MNKKIEVKEGEKYGRLTIISEVDSKYYPNGRIVRKVECKCDCGKIGIFVLTRLKIGHTKSCGCIHIEVASNNKNNFTHGDTKNSIHTYLHSTWSSMKKRCYYKNSKFYKYWGGRGIIVYEPWINDYVSFKKWILENLGERPEKYTLDRIDNNGNYEPGNLRWATRTTQNNNRRKTWKHI